MNRNSPSERQNVHAAILTILAEHKVGLFAVLAEHIGRDLGAGRAEIQRETGFSRSQLATHLQWLKRFGLAHSEPRNSWTASPEEKVCWIHGDRLNKEGQCPTCLRNPKN